MPAVRRSPFILAAVIIVAAVGSSCSSDSVTDMSAPFGLTLKLSPSSATILVADTLSPNDVVRLALAATSFGNPIATPSGVEWTSSDPTVARVDVDGTVHAVHAGTATITARVNSDRATATVVVAYRAVRLAVTPSTITGLAKDTVLLTASALDSAGAKVTGTAYAFTVSDPTIVSITPTGNGTARLAFDKAGTVQVSIKGSGQTVTLPVTVQPREFISTLVAGAPSGSGVFASGEDATCGLLPLGRGYCFGRAGLIGVAKDTSCFNDAPASPTSPCTLVPLRIAGQLNLVSVSVGDSVACGASADGVAYCWGSQKYGQVGNGVSSSASSILPAQVVSNGSTTPAQLNRVAAGGNHACGLTTSGGAWCWGQDSVFQLGGGDGRRVNSTTAIPVAGGNAFVTLSAGRTHTCGLRADGVALCWGDNARGQLGIATNADASDAPVPVAGPAFVSISSGGFHTCALTAAGVAYCWGSNDSGQVGRGLGASGTSTPNPVAGGATFRSISAGRYHTCGVTTAGAAMCWGSNEYGQIGDGGSGASRATPTPVVGGRTDFTSIAVGRRHTCAVGAGGAFCWGSNMLGALGNGLQALVQPTPMKTITPQ